MLPTKFTKTSRIRIGVLLAPPPVQLLDLAPVDLFHMLSKDYLGSIEFLPQPIKDLAINDIEILHIADSEDPHVTTLPNPSTQPTIDSDNPTLQPNATTPSLHLTPLTASLTILTTSLNNPTLSPGSLTILLLPGPDPSSAPSQRLKNFITSHASSGKTDIIIICTGIYPACYAGICDGKSVTGPRGLTGQLTKMFPQVKKFEDLRWTCDRLDTHTDQDKSNSKPTSTNTSNPLRPAELWTSAGITNGQDCIAAYIKSHFDSTLGDVVLRMADVGERGKEYGVGKVGEGIWWVSRIVRAVVGGWWK